MAEKDERRKYLKHQCPCYERADYAGQSQFVNGEE